MSPNAAMTDQQVYDTLRVQVATPALHWWRDGVESESDAHDAAWGDWQARRWAEQNGFRIVERHEAAPTPPQDENVPTDLVTITEAAADLQIDRKPIYTAVERGLLTRYPARRGISTRVSLGAVHEWHRCRTRLPAQEAVAARRQRVAELRQQHLTLTAIAKQIGVSRSTVGNDLIFLERTAPCA
jgi:hypothetical protein